MGVFSPFAARKLYDGPLLTWNLKKHAPSSPLSINGPGVENATTPCCFSSTTREHESAKRWQYGPAICGWKDHAKCDCSAKDERNESAHSGPKQHQPFVGSFARGGLRKSSSGTPSARR